MNDVETGSMAERRNVIRENTDCIIYTLRKGNEEPLFIKEAKTDRGMETNAREFVNQSFLAELSKEKDIGFEFLSPSLDGLRLIYPDISGSVSWLGRQEFFPTKYIAPFSEYWEPMIRFMRCCLDIKFDQLPEMIQAEADDREMYPHFEKDLATLIEKGMLEESCAESLRNRVASGLSNRAFQHHDVVPWHMARRSDGGLILIDSAFGGWALKYLDMAYFSLQMVGYADRQDDALKFLSEIEKQFRDLPDFTDGLATAMGYRGVRLAAELDTQGRRARAERVLSLVTKRFR